MADKDTNVPNKNDFISREAAYKTLAEYYHHSSGVQHTVLREALNRVPTADVRPVVKATWKRIDYKPCGHDYKCSSCGRKNDMKTRFCPNCGAEMEK